MVALLAAHGPPNKGKRSYVRPISQGIPLPVHVRKGVGEMIDHADTCDVVRTRCNCKPTPATLTGNPYQNYITLRGGPAALDGKGYQISDAVVRHGAAYVLAPVPPRYDEGPPIINPHRIAIYERQLKAAGPAATCEARVWIEWHFTGYRAP